MSAMTASELEAIRRRHIGNAYGTGLDPRDRAQVQQVLDDRTALLEEVERLTTERVNLECALARYEGMDENAIPWMLRAEKAEAELAGLRAFRDRVASLAKEWHGYRTTLHGAHARDLESMLEVLAGAAQQKGAVRDE